MQINSGLRSVLAWPLVYRLLNRAIGNEKFRRWFIERIVAVKSGQTLVDLGCGPADILADLDAGVRYIGLDISEAYIEAARQRHGERGLFVAGTVESWRCDPRLHAADVVLAYGLFHHVDDDETLAIFRFARDVLRPGGRFVFLEPCLLVWQARRSVFMMAQDRGQNVRTEEAWKRLIHAVFPAATTSVVTNANRLGYTHIIAECRKDS
ncbi:MAG: hypothetical protein BGP08_20325 [Rhizobiales bacterium 64-17]|nr:MAG: hypothetical protein BGP08_20325 [Rhizobiales bacterium 64-17]